MSKRDQTVVDADERFRRLKAIIGEHTDDFLIIARIGSPSDGIRWSFSDVVWARGAVSYFVDIIKNCMHGGSNE